MTTIAKENPFVTVINVFTVEPENQQALVKMLVEALDRTVKHLPGFVSASIHCSTDGVRVANYAQWRSRENFEAMLKHPEAQAHMKAIVTIAQADAHLYDVVDIRSVTEAPLGIGPT